MDVTSILILGLLTLLLLVIIKYASANNKNAEKIIRGLVEFFRIAIFQIKKRLPGYVNPQKTTVPGLEMTHPEYGNLPEILKAGSLTDFLVNLHQKHGEIVSFYWGKQLACSISSPTLFKEHAKLFDRPPELYSLFRPVITEHSIQYANGPKGQSRHATYTRCFSETALSSYFSVIQETTHNMLQKLTSMPDDEHVPVRKTTFEVTMKTSLLGVFGDYFSDEKVARNMAHSYYHVMECLENQLSGEFLEEGTKKMKLFKQEVTNLHSMLKAALTKVQDDPSNPRTSKFMDELLNLNTSPEEKLADMMTVFLGSVDTPAWLLTWCLYYLALHPEVQHRAAEEAREIQDDPISPDSIGKFIYLRQVLDETMRVVVVAAYDARYSDGDYELGGHIIPGGTPVIHALSVSFQDPQQWPEPKKFDPDRFSPSNRKKIPSFGFEPFGFAGKRKCPGYRLALAEVTVFLVHALRKFEIRLVPGQTVTPVQGIVTMPKEEIWVMFKNRL